ncbi:tetratricopeptide repeat protein [Kiritimatiella glycovorans]|uniref:Outer membrane assembly lipoprotein n=1 Tax=Kiritimatiella glycovorans TaxID=1307763 RepID=A0A0G3EGT6_9BACT|nr:tetratricopeptide repeat protein [Kiritimatiella glycovorans]AKJ65568.1 Outer membrane assembly lipoprotein [Kiritimatiella glycovorans]
MIRTGFRLFLLILAAAAVAHAEPSAREGRIRAALEDGLYDVAARQSREAMRTAEDAGDRLRFRILHARAMLGLGDAAQAFENLPAVDAAAEAGVAPEAAYWRAAALLEDGRPGEALECLDRHGGVLADSGRLPDARRLRFRALRRAGRTERAEATLAGFIDDRSGDVTAGDRLALAEVRIELGRYGPAREVLEQVREQYSGREEAREALLLLAELELRQEDARLNDSTRASLSTMAGREDGLPRRRIRALCFLAEDDRRAERYEEALGRLDRAGGLFADPAQRLRLRKLRAKILADSGRAPEALDLLKEAIAGAADKNIAAELQTVRGDLLYAREEYAEALDAYQAVLDVTSAPAGRLYYNKAWCLWYLQRYAQATPAFEEAARALEGAEMRARAWFKAGDALFRRGQYEEARTRYLKAAEAVQGGPRVPQALYQAHLSAARAGAREEALEGFRELAARYPDHPLAGRARLRIGDIQSEKNDWEKALETYTALAESAKDASVAAEAMKQRGLLLYRHNRFEEALEVFDAVRDEHPGSEAAERAFFMRGFCHLLLGNPERALEICREFARRFPESAWAPEVTFWIGEYYFNHQDYAAARESFEKLADQAEGHELVDDALYWSGRAAAARGEFRAAVKLFSRLAGQFPESEQLPGARFAQGDALTELGEFPRAILAFEEVIREYPDHYLADAAWGRKGDCQFTLGADDPARYREARDSYRMILKSASASSVLRLQAEYKIGRCEEKLGHRTEAVSHYMNAVYSYLSDEVPPTPDAVLWFTRAAFNAATVKERQEEWRQAVKVYERVVEAGVPAAEEAAKRIGRIRLEHVWLF